MDRELANLFLNETSTTLSFLVSEHHFSDPEIQIDNKINFVFVTFMGKNVAIECSLDGYEGDVECTIARVVDGVKPSYRDAVDGRNRIGVRVRERLHSFLQRRGVREQLFTRVAGLEPHERIKVTLADFAKMLRNHGQEILDDSPTALDL